MLSGFFGISHAKRNVRPGKCLFRRRTACSLIGGSGNALFSDGSSGQRAAGRLRRWFSDRTERLLSLRQTMGCGCGSDFRQPSSVLRKGGAGISESSLCRFRGAHVQSRLGSMVHAGSAAGEILSDRTILLLCGESYPVQRQKRAINQRCCRRICRWFCYQYHSGHNWTARQLHSDRRCRLQQCFANNRSLCWRCRCYVVRVRRGNDDYRNGRRIVSCQYNHGDGRCIRRSYSPTRSSRKNHGISRIRGKNARCHPDGKFC